MNKILQFPSALGTIKTMVDGGVSISLRTPELPPEELAILFSLKGGQFWTALAEAPMKAEDLDIKEVRLDSPKTPSERLRSVLFVYWNQNKPTPTFDEFYNKKMGEIIDWIKSKLD